MNEKSHAQTDTKNANIDYNQFKHLICYLL